MNECIIESKEFDALTIVVVIVDNNWNWFLFTDQMTAKPVYFQRYRVFRQVIKVNDRQCLIIFRFDFLDCFDA